MTDNRIVCHIDMDAFYCQVECALFPQLKGLPCVVCQYNPSPGFLVENLLPDNPNRINYSGSTFNTIIAVSYEARAKGVRRLGGQSGQQAKKICPELNLIHVPTQYHKVNLEIYRTAGARVVNVLKDYLKHASDISNASINDSNSNSNSIHGNNSGNGTERERERESPILLEKASIDEVYIDITKECEKRFELLILKSKNSNLSRYHYIQILLKDMSKCTSLAGSDKEEAKMSASDIRRGHSKQGSANVNISSTLLNSSNDNENNDDNENGNTSSWFFRPWHEWTDTDILLVIGANIAKELRNEVYKKLGFTCSAGIAHNKLLSKVASAMHKPNKQTIVPNKLVKSLLNDMPLNRVQGFGGILGENIKEKLNIRTLGQLRAISINILEKYFDRDEAEKILLRAEGADNDPVQSRSQVKSIASSKNFRKEKAFPNSELIVINNDKSNNSNDNAIGSTSTSHGSSSNGNGNGNSNGSASGSATNLERWLYELNSDLADRMEADEHLNSRKPRLLVCGMSFLIQKKKGDEYISSSGISRSIPYPSLTTTTSSSVDQVQGQVQKQKQNADAKLLTEIGLNLLRKAALECPKLNKNQCYDWKISSLSVTGTNFNDIQTGESSISNYFKPGVSASSTGIGIGIGIGIGTGVAGVSAGMTLPASASLTYTHKVDPSGSGRSPISISSMLRKMSPVKSLSKSNSPVKSSELNNDRDSNANANANANANTNTNTNTNANTNANANANASLEEMLFSKGVDVEWYHSMPSDIQQEIQREHLNRNNHSSSITTSFLGTKRTLTGKSTNSNNNNNGQSSLNSAFKRQKRKSYTDSDADIDTTTSTSTSASADTDAHNELDSHIEIHNYKNNVRNANTNTNTYSSSSSSSNNSNSNINTDESGGLTMAEKMTNKRKIEMKSRGVLRLFGNGK
jgi:nucleotidyltransferase/DNA polymerase involved in DNA repair